jgi:hypothetical protein
MITVVTAATAAGGEAMAAGGGRSRGVGTVTTGTMATGAVATGGKYRFRASARHPFEWRADPRLRWTGAFRKSFVSAEIRPDNAPALWS